MHMCRSGGSENRQKRSRRLKRKEHQNPVGFVDGFIPHQQRKKKQIPQTSINSTNPTY